MNEESPPAKFVPYIFFGTLILNPAPGDLSTSGSKSFECEMCLLTRKLESYHRSGMSGKFYVPLHISGFLDMILEGHLEIKQMTNRRNFLPYTYWNGTFDLGLYSMASNRSRVWVQGKKIHKNLWLKHIFLISVYMSRKRIWSVICLASRWPSILM